MKKNIVLFIAFLIFVCLLTSVAESVTWHTSNGTSLSNTSNWGYPTDSGNLNFCGGTAPTQASVWSVNNSIAGPDGQTGIWQLLFPKNACEGAGIGDLYPGGLPASNNEYWVQFWYMYSSNFTFNGIENKVWMFEPFNTVSGVYTSRGWAVLPQGGGHDYYTINRGGSDISHATVPGVWHKIKQHFVKGSPGTIEVWIDDVKRLEYLNVSNWNYDFSTLRFTVIWGGNSGNKVPNDQWLYIDDLYVGDSDPGGSAVVDQVPPYVYGASPPEGSTGNDNTNRNIVAHVADAGSVISNVLRSSVTMDVSINGGAYTTYSYGSGLTFSPDTANDDDFTITRTMGADFAAGDVVSVKINATDVAGNVMTQKTYSFTMAQPATGTAKTRAQVLSYLQGLSGLSTKKVLSGQFGQFLPFPVTGLNIFNLSASAAGGIYPAIMGADVGELGFSLDNTDVSNTTTNLINHWDNGGLVTLSWHMNNPTDNSWTWTSPGGPNVTISELYTSGNARYDNFHTDLDRVAAILQTLEDAGVVVIFRPLHEMNAGPFWWCYKSTSEIILLWQHIHSYLTTTKGLSNLIWSYSVIADYGSEMSYYPGSSYVDVVGIDFYSSTGFYQPGEYSALVGTGKPFMLTEVGQCGPGGQVCSPADAQAIITDIENNMPATIGFVVWNDPYSLYLQNNVTGLFASPYVINRSDNPSGGLASASVTIDTTTLPNGTVGSAYNQQLTLIASGGQSPYTWSLASGTLPAGLLLSTAGVISGIPAAPGTASFTVRVTDANSITDNQALTLLVNPLLPGGQTTVTGAIASFTMINSGSPGTNYYGTAEVYQWPNYTEANLTLLQDNTAKGLPDNISITSATLRGRVSSWEGSGGSNPMLVSVDNVSGTIPNLHTVTWASWAGTRSSALSTASVPLATGWVEWNVLSAVQSAKANNATMTLILGGGANGASDTNRIFDQFEIVIVYTQLVGPEGPSIPAPGKMRVTKFRGTFK